MRSHPSKADLQKAVQSMRRKVIALLMAWKPEQFGVWDTGKMRHLPDMARIYQWINEYGYLKPKWLNKYTYQELTVLVSQIKKITTSSSNGQQNPHKKPKSRDP